MKVTAPPEPQKCRAVNWPYICFNRDALTKMKDVYVKNPQMGDPASVDPRLSEIGQTIEKLQFEVQKFEVCSKPHS